MPYCGQGRGQYACTWPEMPAPDAENLSIGSACSSGKINRSQRTQIIRAAPQQEHGRPGAKYALPVH